MDLRPLDFDPFAEDEKDSGPGLRALDFDPFAEETPKTGARPGFLNREKPDTTRRIGGRTGYFDVPKEIKEATESPDDRQVDDFGTWIGKVPAELSGRAQQWALGLTRMTANSQWLRGEDRMTKEYNSIVAPEYRTTNFDRKNRENLDKLDAFAKQTYRDVTDDLRANAPKLDPNSASRYAHDIIIGAAEMVPVVATTVLTRNPTMGSAVMGGEVMGAQYAESREKGRTHDEAVGDATFYAAAESLPEMVPLGMLIKPGGTFLARTLKQMGAEGAQEMLTQIMQTGYDVGVLKEDMTWGEAVRAVVDAGIVGAGIGGGMSVMEAPWHLTEEPKPAGELQKATQPQANLTPEDRASPIPDAIIAKGKAIVGQATANQSANDILSRIGMPEVGTRVNLSYPDGREIGGEVIDGFSTSNVETGLSDDGVKIRLDNGTIFEEFAGTIQQAGVQISAENGNVSREIEAVNHVSEQEKVGETDTVQQVREAAQPDQSAVLPGVPRAGEPAVSDAEKGGGGLLSGVAQEAEAPRAPAPVTLRPEAEREQPDLLGGPTVRESDAIAAERATSMVKAARAELTDEEIRAALDEHEAKGSYGGHDLPGDVWTSLNVDPSLSQRMRDVMDREDRELARREGRQKAQEAAPAPKATPKPAKALTGPVPSWNDVYKALPRDENGSPDAVKATEAIKAVNGGEPTAFANLSDDQKRQLMANLSAPVSARQQADTPQAALKAKIEGNRAKSAEQKPNKRVYDADRLPDTPERDAARNALSNPAKAAITEWVESQFTGLQRLRAAAASLWHGEANEATAEDKAILREIYENGQAGRDELAKHAVDGKVKLYRGLRPGGEGGASLESYTVDPSVARNFAADGKVETVMVPLEDVVYAYGENEGEVIVRKTPTKQDALKAKIANKRQGSAKSAEHNGTVPIEDDRERKRLENITKAEKAGLPTSKLERKEIGKNADGETIYEDGRGVRSVVKDGARTTEKIRLGRPGTTEVSVDRGPDMDQRFKPVEESAPKTEGKPYGSENKLVTADRAEELRKRLKAKLKNQLNSGIDPEILAMGAELAAFHIEAGARKFTAFAKRIADDLGMEIADLSKYLRGWYNGARDMMEDAGHSIEGMDGPDEVRAALAALKEESNGLQNAVPSRDEGEKSEDAERASPDRGAGRAPSEEGNGGERDVRPTDGGRAEDAERGREKPVRNSASGGNRAGNADRLPAGDAGSVKGENFHIEEGALQEDRGFKQKAKDNIRAIELMRQIESEDRLATADEQAILAKYVGWGGIKGAFPDTDGNFAKGYEDIGAKLKELLPAESYETARRSIQYAHYTSETIVREMWRLAQNLGFNGGNVFEPGMGVGNFAGMMPRDVASKTQYHGLEFDHMTARLAKLLYPKWGVMRADYTNTKMPKDTYDLVIGNPPFADIPIKSDPEYAKHGFLLHDYFFAKSLDSVRPGGLLMFVTSAGTMNKMDAKARQYMADRADFIGGVRLPGDAFEKNAGTKVTTDILVFKKRAKGEKPGGVKDWTGVEAVTLPNKNGEQISGNVASYFVRNPDMVLGEQGFFDPLYENRYGVKADGRDFKAALSKAMDKLGGIVMNDAPTSQEKSEIDFASTEAKEGSFYLDKAGRLMQKRDGVGHPVKERGKGVEGGFSSEQRERIRKLIPIRDSLRAVYAADLSDNAAAAAKARKELNAAYDAFVAEYGPINLAKFQYRRPTAVQAEAARNEAREEARERGAFFDEGSFNPIDLVEREAPASEIARQRAEFKAQMEKEGKTYSDGDFNPDDMADIVIDKRPNIDPFMDDPESYRLRAIEHYDDKTGEAKKGRVFTENVISREKKPEINSVNDALLHVLNKVGRVDIDRIAEASKKTPAEVIESLGENIFKTPGTHDNWELRDAYLSGNVREKLEIAKQAAEQNPEFERNVKALEKAQPAPIPPSQIGTHMGMPWIPDDVFRDFGRELGLESLRVKYVPKLAQWFVSGDDRSAAATSTWGTSRRAAPLLISDALNQTDPKIYDMVSQGYGEKPKPVLNVEDTQADQDKVTAIRDKFSEWVFADPERAARLAGIYNRDYNNLVVREYDGSYIDTPGVATDWHWRPHQQRAIARIIQSGNTYLAHAVGAGKTAEMIAAGMEMRRLGMVKKPMYAVPNHMLGQFTKEFYQQYPGARIAVADERQFHTDRRKQFIANVANEDLDAVIITHSAFGKIPISEGFLDGIIQEQIDDYRYVLSQMPKKKGDEEARRSRSRVEKLIQKLEQRLSGRKKNDQDQVFSFEEMGVDFLFVDEAHLFRKLDFATQRSNVKGITPQGSKMSFDLYAKSRYLETINPGRSLVLASGTPVTNTMAELFTLSRYIQRDELMKRNLDQFDAWASAFGTTATNLEQDAAGGYNPVTRFSKFVNVPELSAMVRQVMDVVTSRQLSQYVARPNIKGGQRKMNLAEKSELLEDYQKELTARMDLIAKRKGPPSPGDDIILSVTNDGRKAAIDMRLVDPTLPNDPGSKLNLLIDNVYDIWKKTQVQPFHTPTKEGYAAKPVDKGPAAQMIFANLGIGEGSKFNIVKHIKRELMDRQVPAEQIAFISDYKSHVAKQRLFNDVNEGKVRILIGSTSKMATGVNAQRRLYAVHNLDPLWYPADDEQRNGRIIRQGNMNPEIEIHDYSTKGTYDSTMWGMMETKARFIQGFFEGDPNLRDMEDLGEASQYEQAKAMTTNDPRLIELTNLRQELEREVRRERAFESEQYAIQVNIREANRDIDYNKKRIAAIEKDIAQRTDTSGDNFNADAFVGGAKKSFDDRTEFGGAVLENINSLKEQNRKIEHAKIAQIGGFSAFVDIAVMKGAKGDPVHIIRPYIERNGDHRTEFNIGESAIGIARSIESALGNFETNKTNAEKRIADAERVISEFTPKIGGEYPNKAKISELRGQVQAIEGQLKAETTAANTAMMAQAAPEDVEPSLYVEREAGPEFVGKIEEVADELWKVMKRLGLDDKVSLLVSKSLKHVYQGVTHNVGGLYHGGVAGVGRLIEVALDAFHGVDFVLHHESIHAMRELGLFTKEEWATLERSVSADKMREIRQRYGSYNMTHEKHLEEAIADMFGDYMKAKLTKSSLRRIFDKMKKMLRALGQAVFGAGFRNASDIFGDIDAGIVGRRERQQRRDDAGRFAQEETTGIDDAGPMGMSEKFMQGSGEPKFSLPPRPVGANDKMTFDNPESEKRLQAAKGGIAGAEDWKSKFKAWAAHIGHGFSRHFIFLPNTKTYAEVNQKLRILQAAPQASKERIVRQLHELTKNMNRDDLDLFTRKVILDDLSWEASQQHLLPFAMTEADVVREKGKIDAIMARRPDLAEAVRQRKLMVRAVANELVRVGVLHKDQVQNPAYYRHQVLEYVAAVKSNMAGTGKKLRTPYWAKRMGSSMDINANLLEAELDWMHKAYIGIETAKTIDWIKGSDHNIRKDVIAQAKAHNDALVREILDAEGTNGPLRQEHTKFRQLIAMGMAHIKKVLDDGSLVPPAEFQDTADNLAVGLDDAQVFPFMAWILDNNQAGAMGAAMVFKGISQRREWAKNLLGKRYADPTNMQELVKRFAPEGYVTWQPDSPDGKGRALRLYVAKTIPEQAVDRIVQHVIAGANLPGDLAAFTRAGLQQEVTQALTVGSAKYEMVIPKELADTLNNLRSDYDENIILHVIEAPTKAWKVWTLINPRRWAKYNINNLSGDLDAVIAGNPRILKKSAVAAKELYQVMVQKKKPSARYEEAISHGVFDSGFSIQEVPEINTLSEFERLTKPMNWKNPLTLSKAALSKGWGFLQKSTQLRENIFRYAAYLDYIERIEAGEKMDSIGYGASRREIIDAIEDKKDKAALLARDLLGDYGAISKAGQDIRRYLIPFWSFMEINAKRYWRLNQNAWGQGFGKGLRTTGVTGAALGLRTTAYLYLRMIAVYALVTIWNNLFFPDDEDELDPETRTRLHLNLGRDENGEMRTMRLQGSLSDIFSWFGIEDAAAALYEVERGRADLLDVLKAIAKAPINKIINGVTPTIKAPLEAAAGVQLFPDAFNARPVRDSWRNMFKTFSLENEYDLVMGNPSRGYGRSWQEAVVYKKDTGENNYNRIRTLAYNWLEREKGQEGYSAMTTPRSNALYKLRLAMKFKDKEAEKSARKELRELGADAKDIEASIKRAHPLGPIPIKDRAAFLRTLSADERAVLNSAQKWYRDTFLD